MFYVDARCEPVYVSATFELNTSGLFWLDGNPPASPSVVRVGEGTPASAPAPAPSTYIHAYIHTYTHTYIHAYIQGSIGVNRDR